MPVLLRTPHRTWLTTKGHVVNTAPQVSEDHHEPGTVNVCWTVKVVDNVTDMPIEDFPELSGEMKIDASSDFREKAIESYVARCRFLDGEKLDINLLLNNINAGIWEYDTHTVNMEETTLMS